MPDWTPYYGATSIPGAGWLPRAYNHHPELHQYDYPTREIEAAIKPGVFIMTVIR